MFEQNSYNSDFLKDIKQRSLQQRSMKKKQANLSPQNVNKHTNEVEDTQKQQKPSLREQQSKDLALQNQSVNNEHSPYPNYQANNYFQQMSDQESVNFPINSDHIREINSSIAFSQSPVELLKQKQILESSNPIQRTVDYQLKLSQEQNSVMNDQYRKKRNIIISKSPISEFERFYSQDPDAFMNKTYNFSQELQDNAQPSLNRYYMNKKLTKMPLKKAESQPKDQLALSQKQSQRFKVNKKGSKFYQDRENQEQFERQRISIKIPQQPKQQKEQLFSQDEVDLKKQLIFSLILTFIFLHLYYALQYKLEYFTVTNLFLIFLWITISPHFQQKFTIKTQSKQLYKTLFQFIKTRYYHFNVNKRIFKLIFWNFFIVDLGFLKILIGKLGIFHQQIQNSSYFKSLMQNYVDLNFINTLQKIFINSWSLLVNGFNNNENSQANPDQFFLIKVFNFFAKIFHWIFIILSAIFSFFTNFFAEFALHGQYFLYLVLIILCAMITFKNFFKVSEKIKNLIETTVTQKVEKLMKKQEAVPPSVDKSQKQMPLIPEKTQRKTQRKDSFQGRNKKRKSSSGSNLSQVQINNLKRSLQESQYSQVYQQFSKYLLIVSLVFIYCLCYLSEESYSFLFFESVSVKQAWSLLLCLYSFLIVEYCKRNQQMGQKINSDQKWFKLKMHIATFLMIILILHDFVISKDTCQRNNTEVDAIKTTQCFYSHSRYKYFFDELFFNPHVQRKVLPEDKFRLNIIVQYVMKLVILLNFRFHKFYLFQSKKSYFTPEEQIKLFQDDRQSVDNPNLAESFYTTNSIGGVSTQSYKLKKKVAKISKNFQRKTLILLILTILIMTLTNSISNIIILIGVFVNIPFFRDSKFRNYLMVGLSLGLIIQPNQLLYFVLLIFVIYVRGQDMVFKMHSHWILIQFTQLYIMFSKVSVINFLMGLMPSGVLVMYCISFRIIFNYFEWISVFMGTEDNYTKSYFYNLVPNSFFVDASLWIFMILLKTHAPNLANKFPNSNITNIFKQYPMIQKIEPVLKIFKIIQLVSYVTIELIVFTETPSIIVFTRLFMHLIIVAVDLANQKANETLKNLWKANLYVSLFIAFLKYFYLLNRYENLSNWLIVLLQPLQNNWALIGLWPSQRINSVFALIILFLPDLCIIILSMLVQYSLQVKIFESYRQLFVKKQQKGDRDDSNSQQSSPSNKLSSSNINQQQNRVEFQTNKESTIFILPQPKHEKNIQYLYKNYIKEHKFKFMSTSFLGKLLSDFFYDIYFLLLCLVYILLQDTNSFAGFWLNLPHFIIAFIIFIHQQDRKLPKMTFLYSIMYSCATLLLLYMKYLYSYVTLQTNGQGSYFYNLSDILNKYIFFLLGCLFYKLHDDLKEQLQMSNGAKIKERRKNMFYSLIMPNFDAKFPHIFIKEITILWINFFKSTILAIFVANFFTSTQNALFNIMMIIYLLIILAFPHHLGFHAQEDTLRHYWVYPFLLSFCFTIWKEDMIGYAGLIMIRLYIIFFMEFQQAIDFMFCEYVTQSQKHLVEKIDDKFDRRSIAKLSIIPEEKQGLSRVILSQEQESSKAWPYRNLYKTVLLVLPQSCMILMLCSQILLYKNYFPAVMCLLILAIFFYTVKYIEAKKVFSDRVKKLMKIYFGVSLKIILVITFFQNYKNEVSLRLGVSLLCLGFFYFMYLVQKVDKEKLHFYLISKALRVVFMQSRSSQALLYWQIKSEFVSELGSQIHNEKKLLKLQKFYITKQKVSRRVQKLIQDIQQRGRQNFRKNYSAADFDIIDQIIDYREEGTKLQLFSNMLLILSLEDLQYCLEMMNHYYRPCVEKRNFILKSSRSHMLGQSQGEINDLITAEMREIRQNVLKTYHGSIYMAFKQYKHSLHEELRRNTLHMNLLQGQMDKSHVSDKHQQYQDYSQFSDEQEMVNFQKAEFMDDKYNKCMERIHQKSMEIGWIWRKIIQNSEIISMVIVTGWNFFGGVYAIPANFAIFAWALVLQTKTTVLLWSFFFLYSGFIIIIKFILPQLPSLPILNFIFYYYPRHCYYEFIIILVSFIQIILIKLGGTENVTYFERESIYDAFYRKGLNKAAHKIQSELEPQFIEVYKTLSQPSKHSFFYRVFSKSRLKPGKDFYPLMSGIQLLILMYIFFFYDMMEFQSRNNRKSLGQILTVNQFSRHMMIILFTQVIIMILDRFIASLNLIDVKNQALENFLLNFAFSDHIKYRSPENVTHVGFFDFLLILKYLFHTFLLILINFFVYFYIPSSGFEKSLIPQCQNAICGKSYTFLSIFLLLYLAYFVVSGLQIKHGFSHDKCRNKLMEKHHWINYYTYVIFTGIPFLWEFKKICDWTITTTALPLFHWMKFQDINARLYQSKCEAQMLKIKPRAKTPLSKYFLGPVGCIFILGVVFSPLLLYSSLNPFAVKDEVLAAQVKFNLLVNGSVEYKFFSTSHSIITQNVTKIPESYRDQFESSQNLHSSINFEDNNDFYLKMSSYPDQNFKISQPAIEKLSSRIGRAVEGRKYRFFDMVLNTKIIQKQGGQNSIEWARKRLNNTELSLFKQFILPSAVSNVTNTTVKPQTKYFKLQNFYSPIPGTIQNKTICLTTTNDGQYYELYTPDKVTNECKKIEEKNDQNPGILLFYSSSTKYKVSFGLLTFYVTYVLLISRLFRIYLTGNLDNIIYEGCHLERMLILCDAVRQARILQNLYQEEYLYAFLVDLMRNPRKLKEMSGQFTELRLNLPLQEMKQK